MIHQVCDYCSRQRKFSMVSTNKGCQHSGWQRMPTDAVKWQVNWIKPHLHEKKETEYGRLIYSLYSRYTPENIYSLKAAKNTYTSWINVRKLCAEIETAKGFSGKTSESELWKCWMWATMVSVHTVWLCLYQNNNK